MFDDGVDQKLTGFEEVSAVEGLQVNCCILEFNQCQTQFSLDFLQVRRQFGRCFNTQSYLIQNQLDHSEVVTFGMRRGHFEK